VLLGADGLVPPRDAAPNHQLAQNLHADGSGGNPGAALGAARDAKTDSLAALQALPEAERADVLRVARAWPSLTPEQRAAVLRLVEAAQAVRA
jgi:hypothetical protein